MNIFKDYENDKLTIALEGRLDTTTAPSLEAALSDIPEQIIELVLDFKKLEYLSSAGLRVILIGHKAMLKKNGKMIVKNINDLVAEVFEMTGFSDILNIQ